MTWHLLVGEGTTRPQFAVADAPELGAKVTRIITFTGDFSQLQAEAVRVILEAVDRLEADEVHRVLYGDPDAPEPRGILHAR